MRKEFGRFGVNRRFVHEEHGHRQMPPSQSYGFINGYLLGGCNMVVAYKCELGVGWWFCDP